MDFNATKFSLNCHILLAAWVFSASCATNSTRSDDDQQVKKDSVHVPQIIIADSTFAEDRSQPADSISAYYQMLEKLGAVTIGSLDSSIIIDLKYASTENFLSYNLYGEANKAYLQKEVAQALVIAQTRLKAIDTSLNLIVYDALRPLSVQTVMWDKFDVELELKRKFIANPKLVSMHNLGFAVDVSIRLADGTDLDMGTEFDDWSEIAYPCLEHYFAEKGLLGYNHINNRSILRFVMELAGFTQNKYEWWHFYYSSKSAALAKYPVIEDFKSYSSPTYTTVSLTSDQVIFSVQLAASRDRMSKNRLCTASAKEYKHEGMYKYCAGEFNDLESTYKFRDSLLNSSCKNAFVIAFINGERISLQQALSLIETE